MRFRLGLILGFALGYVLGAKAGRDRYEQIMRTARSMRRSEPAQQIEAEMRDVAHRASEFIETKASEGVAKVTELAHKGNGRNGGSPTAAQ